jgi:hypothetical protein
MMDGRLIGAARLQIVGSDQLHVGGFGRRTDDLLLRIRTAATRDENDQGIRDPCDAISHAFHPGCLKPIFAG